MADKAANECETPMMMNTAKCDTFVATKPLTNGPIVPAVKPIDIAIDILDVFSSGGLEELT